MGSGIFDKSAAYWMIPLQIKWGAVVRADNGKFNPSGSNSALELGAKPSVA
jgi:hypothetical protein